MELDQWCVADEGVGNVIDPIVENKWYHVAATWDGTYNRVYVNGALVKTGTSVEIAFFVCLLRLM